MSNAWGGSFGVAWGVSWGSGAPTPTPTQAPTVGNWNKLRGKKKKPKAIKFRDFESREEISAKTIIIEPASPLDEEEEADELILLAIKRLLH